MEFRNTRDFTVKPGDMDEAGDLLWAVALVNKSRDTITFLMPIKPNSFPLPKPFLRGNISLFPFTTCLSPN
jgi:hypothetical protein